ncbi:phosphoribosylaminoimidazole succinocarboxamide synthase [Bdellovibrio sp. qaytius]|nr:phosphoribosylaminoimidazole succinocarboxamide synthase [Bdellovibrio sp. qaytius]
MNTLPPVLYQGSVKNVRGLANDPSLVFEYSDRYSVFDWGEMPDQITGKGAALNLMGYAFFQYLEKQIGLKHHMLGLVGSGVTNTCEVKNVKVVRPEKMGATYNYQPYQDRLTNALVPLEVIFRLGLAQGNSLSKRFKSNPDLAKQFGLTSVPEEGMMLEKPLIDFSTKLEAGDRYVTYSEAKSLSGMSETEFQKLIAKTTEIALSLKDFHQKMGLELWDGKVEFAFVQGVTQDRDFMLVDSIGIDELRLISEGKSLSKEFLREVYKDTQWYNALNASKEEAHATNGDFKEICKNKYQQIPPNLSNLNKQKAQDLYQAYCNSVYAQMNLPLPFNPELNVKNYEGKYL